VSGVVVAVGRGAIALTLGVLVSCASAVDTTNRDSKLCVVSGCSRQICTDQQMMTTCEWRDEYACYHTARCERQADGKCGWTQSDELKRCLASPPRR